MPIVSFANQKGGVGKSTLTMLLADYLFYVKKKSVYVIDVDKQKSLGKKRIAEKEKALRDIIAEFEEKGIEIDFEQKEKLSAEVEKEFYPISLVDLKDLEKRKIQLGNQIIGISQEYDYVIIDFPGSIDVYGVLDAYKYVDHIFIPTSLSDLDLDSTFEYVDIINEKIIPLRKSVGLNTTTRAILNKVSTKSIEYKSFEEINKNGTLKVDFLNTIIPDSVKISRLISTRGINFDSSDKNIENNVNELLNEIYNIIKN